MENHRPIQHSHLQTKQKVNPFHRNKLLLVIPLLIATGLLLVSGTVKAFQNSTGGGADLSLESEIMDALPGNMADLLNALDTHTRLRPGGRIAGISSQVVSERREIITGEKSDFGTSTLALSPLGRFGESGCWNMTVDPTGRARISGSETQWGRLIAGARTSSFSGITGDAQLSINPRPLMNTTVQADMALHYTSADDIDPRATAGGALPHNDGARLDLIANLRFGSAATTVAFANGNSVSGPRKTEQKNWGLNLTLVSEGTTRNHYFKEYIYNPEHAPHEEIAQFQTAADFHYQLSEQSTARLTLGYERYLRWLGDGSAKTNLSGYTRFLEEGNGDPDPSGLYWADAETSANRPHVYDYFVRNFTTTLHGQLELDHSFSERAQGGLRLARTRYSYHHYEHFSPTSYFTGSNQSFQDAVIIGYTEDGRSTSDQFSNPGIPAVTMAGAWGRYQVANSAWLDCGLAGHWFFSGESALRNPRRPLGDDNNFTPADLEATETKFDPIGRLAIRFSPGKWSFWGLGYRTTHLPPLEAVYSPSAYLAPALKDEGVMGNPDLAPEKETGAELGFSRQLQLFGHPFKLQMAGYAARIDEALTLLTASYDVASDTRNLLTYDNGGELQQVGLHIDGTFAMIQRAERLRPLWLRLSYDLSRTESDHLEPTLLNNSWLYPNDPAGEYESQGYSGRLGGLYDIIGTGGWDAAHGSALDYGNFHPSDLDRTHQFSVALITQTATAGRRAAFWRKWFSNWTIGALFTFETGRPYTQTYLYPAGLVAQPVLYEELEQIDPLLTSPDATVERNSSRIDTASTLDLAFTRWLKIGNRSLQISLEALNVLETENQTAVYRATGYADDDGCEEYGCIPVGVTETEYQARLQDPRHYDRPLTLRAGIAIALP